MSKEVILKATHGSDEKPLKIGNIEIPCYVLENGQRVLSRNGMLRALGLSRGGKRGNDGGDRLSVFVGSKALQSFISNDLMVVIETPIKFTHPTGGGTAYGYDAEILQTIVRATGLHF